jgi:hypothetical protein
MICAEYAMSVEQQEQHAWLPVLLRLCMFCQDCVPTCLCFLMPLLPGVLQATQF